MTLTSILTGLLYANDPIPLRTKPTKHTYKSPSGELLDSKQIQLRHLKYKMPTILYYLNQGQPIEGVLYERIS